MPPRRMWNTCAQSPAASEKTLRGERYASAAPFVVDPNILHIVFRTRGTHHHQHGAPIHSRGVCISLEDDADMSYDGRPIWVCDSICEKATHGAWLCRSMAPRMEFDRRGDILWDLAACIMRCEYYLDFCAAVKLLPMQNQAAICVFFYDRPANYIWK